MCIVNKWVVGWVFMGALAANVTREVGSGKMEVSKLIRVLLAAGRGSKMQND